MRRIRSKIRVQHRAKCSALVNVENGIWDTPWAFFQDKAVYADSMGRRNGSTHRWRTAGCNSVLCPGQVMVLEEDLLMLLQNK